MNARYFHGAVEIAHLLPESIINSDVLVTDKTLQNNSRYHGRDKCARCDN